MKRLLLTLVLLLTAVMTVNAQGDEEQYTSPDDLFSVPIPTGWTVTEADGYAVLTDPSETIDVYVLSVESDDLNEAVDSAFNALLPDFDLLLADAHVMEVPSDAGVESTVIITYSITQSGDVVYQGVGQWVDGRAYLILFDANIAESTRRQSQINLIATGFRIHAIDQSDLSDASVLPIDESLIAEFEEFVTYVLEQTEVPGAAIAIVQNGQVVYANGFGVTELGQDTPVTANTLMMIGSTTKTFTTLFLAQLVDEGIITWDTPVVDIFPDFALADEDITQIITVRNMVCACIGVPRRDLEMIFNASELTAGDVIASLADYQLFTGFGEAFQYSNQLIATGGYIGTIAAGGTVDDAYQNYVTEIDTRILTPLGMSNTYFDFDQVQATGNAASPHGSNLEAVYSVFPLEGEQFVTPVAPAGALWSTVNDMGQYLIMLMQDGIAPDGTRIVSEENLYELWQPQVNISATTRYGLGWIVDEYQGLPVLHHGGNTFGFSSDLAFLPTADTGIVILTNGYGANVFTEVVRMRLFELLFNLEDESARTALDFQLQQAAQEVDYSISDDLDFAFFEDFVGTYESVELGGLDVRIEDNQLVLDSGELAITIRAILDADGALDGYVTYESPIAGLPVEFNTDENGNPQIILDIVTDRYIFTWAD